MTSKQVPGSVDNSQQNDGVDYGPLTLLVGRWKGDKGVDVAPEPGGSEQTPFYETITFEASGDVTNAASQHLAVLRYHQVVQRVADDEVFHNETGYWIWDAERNIIMQTLTIPRGVALLAGGTHQAGSLHIEVNAGVDDLDWGIIQSPFMRDNAKTLSFRHRIRVDGDTLSYDETTILDIYGKQFEHTDTNELRRA